MPADAGAAARPMPLPEAGALAVPRRRADGALPARLPPPVLAIAASSRVLALSLVTLALNERGEPPLDQQG
ncbi:hypothetical protein [Bradyrhizobium sp. DASA03120]|uniref:hypothetical protein n=1 Tax=Bradyrhizobium sp. SMVTL-02 TaxID=3395917 RepID=UPI003F7000D8